jgi:hypothetical protein
MNAAQPPEREDAESARDRRTANIVLVGFIILVVGGGLWMMNAFFNQRAMNDCLAEGRRDCVPIDVPGR